MLQHVGEGMKSMNQLTHMLCNSGQPSEKEKATFFFGVRIVAHGLQGKENNRKRKMDNPMIL